MKRIRLITLFLVLSLLGLRASSAPRVQVLGLMTLRDQSFASLKGEDDVRSLWVAAGDTFNGYRVHSMNIISGTVVLERDAERYTIVLKEAAVLSNNDTPAGTAESMAKKDVNYYAALADRTGNYDLGDVIDAYMEVQKRKRQLRSEIERLVEAQRKDENNGESLQYLDGFRKMAERLDQQDDKLLARMATLEKRKAP